MTSAPDAWPEQDLLAFVAGEPVGLLVAERDLARNHPAPAGPSPVDAYDLSPDIWQVVSASFVGDRGDADVLSGLGLRSIRPFWRMLLDLAAFSPMEPPAPAGVNR